MADIIVSVIIPVFNGKKYIEDAIRSVFKQAVKTEIIVIDDASSDGTEIILHPYIITNKIIYIRNDKNLGVAYSRNKGIQTANGDYIAFLDCDDWWQEEKLRKQINLLKDTNVPFCYTGRELFNEQASSLRQFIRAPLKVTYNELLYTNVIACSSVVIRREIALEFPMVHDELHEDYIMWLLVLKKYGFAVGINEPLLKTRLTKSGKSRNKLKTFYMTFGVYRYVGINRFISIYYTINHVIRSGLRYLKGKVMNGSY